MPRRLANWLESYVKYAGVSEAPKIFHFWAGVSAIAGALRRHVWFDQIKFKWYPSFYIIFVAPPGIATKSTTADGSMNLLREVPGIKFGPDEVTWQSLVTSFAASSESFQVGDLWYPQSAITIVASEFGMYMDFKDTKMVNLHITLWDGRNQFEKQTKMSGNDLVEAPWINLLACTTPQWIHSSMDANTIGGGFTSRCVFVFGDKKEQAVAYIKNQIREQSIGDYEQLKLDLIHDLEDIAVNLLGEYVLTPEAEAWGEGWYKNLWEKLYITENEDYVNNYLARKQAHMHKLAMILAAAQSDNLIITYDNLRLAETMLDATEANMKKVFARVGRTEDSIQSDKILTAIAAKGEMPYQEAYRLSQIYFPNGKDFEGILSSFIRAGQLQLVANAAGQMVLRYTGPAPL
jgi:hypothetical protein